MHRACKIVECCWLSSKRLRALSDALATTRPFSRWAATCIPGSALSCPKQTGRRFKIKQIWIFALANDKITGVRGGNDPLGLLAIAGLGLSNMTARWCLQLASLERMESCR
jgi:hypothetical protein